LIWVWRKNLTLIFATASVNAWNYRYFADASSTTKNIIMELTTRNQRHFVAWSMVVQHKKKDCDYSKFQRDVCAMVNSSRDDFSEVGVMVIGWVQMEGWKRMKEDENNDRFPVLWEERM
jgi:hypothetical protein